LTLAAVTVAWASTEATVFARFYAFVEIDRMHLQDPVPHRVFTHLLEVSLACDAVFLIAVIAASIRYGRQRAQKALVI